ncbi:MAG: hypothetical protein ABUS79_06180, partial [Pseudomonadota bacterium]
MSVAAAAMACGHAGTTFPWPAADHGGGGGRGRGASHSEVTTLNKAYRRDGSQVLVRRIARATRANLDYAAYHANFMNADPPPERPGGDGGAKEPDTSTPFDGALDVASLIGSIGGTPLTAAERAHPLALAPLVELLTSKHIPGADALENVASRVRAETWGLGGGPQLARQLATLAYLHQPKGGGPTQVWIKVEFASWFKTFDGLPDGDGDGFGEVYGRVP